jgi:hypothetical protein
MHGQFPDVKLLIALLYGLRVLLVKGPHEIALEIEKRIKREFDEVMELKVRIESNKTQAD